jgi:hypothetical protein
MAAKKKTKSISWDSESGVGNKDMLLSYLKNILTAIGQIYNEEMFELMLKYLSSEFKEKLYHESIDYAGKIKLDVEYIDNSYQDGTNDLHESLTDLFRRWQLRKKLQKKMY